MVRHNKNINLDNVSLGYDDDDDDDDDDKQSLGSTTKPADDAPTIQELQHDGILPPTMIIVGGGITGLVLALALKRHLKITVEIFEKGKATEPDVGAAMGMYPNGLRVLRDIDPRIVQEIRQQGATYEYRQWTKHNDASHPISKAYESPVLNGGDDELSSIGICRWKLQHIFYRAIQRFRIPIYFGKGCDYVVSHAANGQILVNFEDGTTTYTDILFACDGARSKVRQQFTTMDLDQIGTKVSKLRYIGTTCFMGISKCPRHARGITFPSSTTSPYHAVYFPVGKDEECFQIHMPVDELDADKQNWSTLRQTQSTEQCRKLAMKLRDDGWDQIYIDPLRFMTRAVQVGFCLLEPPLKQWVYHNNKVVLVGDAAHPPVPFIGQGAQMGIEDAGTIAWLLKLMCWDRHSKKYTFQQNFAKAMSMYQKIRIKRVAEVEKCSREYGDMECQRGVEKSAKTYPLDSLIEGEVLENGTLSVLLPAASYNYRKEIKAALQQHGHVEITEEEYEQFLQNM